MKFYVNKQNGDIAVTGEGELGSDYTLLTANSTDAAQEKHVPVVTVDGDVVRVAVGSVPHPMTEAHLISLVALQTSKGWQVHRLSHTDAPQTEFMLTAGEKPIAVYEYCNLHGLWVCRL